MSRRFIVTPNMGRTPETTPALSEGSLETLDTEKVFGSRYNPETRTKEGVLDDLIESIKEHGQLMPVVVVDFGDHYQLADGHRRITAIEALGMKTVRALVRRDHGGDPQALLDRLFVELNSGVRPFNGRDRLNVALQDGPVFDPNTKSIKLQLESLFSDPAEREMLVNKEITSTVFNVAKKSTRYVLGKDIGETTPTFRNRLRNHVLYLLRNPAQQVVIQYMRLEYEPEGLKKAIDNNKPPPRVSSDKLKEKWKKTSEEGKTRARKMVA